MLASLLYCCLSSTWIGSVLVGRGLVPVLHEVLYVAHLVVDSEQILHDDSGALLDPAQ
jgi:hypothetical protein